MRGIVNGLVPRGIFASCASQVIGSLVECCHQATVVRSCPYFPGQNNLMVLLTYCLTEWLYFKRQFQIPRSAIFPKIYTCYINQCGYAGFLSKRNELILLYS